MTLYNIGTSASAGSENAYDLGREDRLEDEPYSNPYSPGSLPHTLYDMGFNETDTELAEREPEPPEPVPTAFESCYDPHTVFIAPHNKEPPH